MLFLVLVGTLIAFSLINAKDIRELEIVTSFGPIDPNNTILTEEDARELQGYSTGIYVVYKIPQAEVQTILDQADGCVLVLEYMMLPTPSGDELVDTSGDSICPSEADDDYYGIAYSIEPFEILDLYFTTESSSIQDPTDFSRLQYSSGVLDNFKTANSLIFPFFDFIYYELPEGNYLTQFGESNIQLRFGKNSAQLNEFLNSLEFDYDISGLNSVDRINNRSWGYRNGYYGTEMSREQLEASTYRISHQLPSGETTRILSGRLDSRALEFVDFTETTEAEAIEIEIVTQPELGYSDDGNDNLELQYYVINKLDQPIPSVIIDLSTDPILSHLGGNINRNQIKFDYLVSGKNGPYTYRHDIPEGTANTRYQVTLTLFYSSLVLSSGDDLVQELSNGFEIGFVDALQDLDSTGLF